MIYLLLFVSLPSLVIFSYISWSRATSFIAFNKVAFESCIMTETKLCDDTRKEVQEQFMLNSPSFIKVFLACFITPYTLSRKRFYSQENIDLFFNSLSQNETLNNPNFLAKQQDISIYK